MHFDKIDTQGVEIPSLPCPRCGQFTDSLKQYSGMHLMVFLIAGAWYQSAKYTACPRCMRGILLQRTLINTITANLLAPFIWIFHGVQYCRSFKRGHSKTVCKMFER
jgi:hypothetical protein